MTKLHLLGLSFSVPFFALTHGCAGELEGDPSRFLDGSVSATGAGGSQGTGGSGAGMGGGGTMTTGCDMAVPYLTMTCGIAGCHGGPTPQVNLDLSSMGIGNGQQYINAHPTGVCANNVPLIDPNNAQNSLLYLILQNEPPRPCGFLMPYGLQTPIPQAQQTCILQWIQGVIAGGGGGG